MICDACASGGDINSCKEDNYLLIKDACNRPFNYCNKYRLTEVKVQ
jgi:hypothetical protein